MIFEYLLFNLAIATAPFFVYRFLYKKFPAWMPALYALTITAGFFIIMDAFVTGWWWEFNPRFVIGRYIIGLPVEELLFFLVVPVVCLHIWVAMSGRFTSVMYPRTRVFRIRRIISALFVALGLLTGLSDLLYTSVILMVLGFVVYLDEILKTHLLEKKLYYRFIELVIVLTLVCNGYLTWRPVVLYESSVKTNVMVGTIPLEDFIYGVSLIMLITILYEWFQKNSVAKPPTK